MALSPPGVLRARRGIGRCNWGPNQAEQSAAIPPSPRLLASCLYFR